MRSRFVCIILASTAHCLIAILALVHARAALAAHPEPARFVSTSDGARIAYYPLLAANTVPLLVLSGGPGSDSSYMRARGALDQLARTHSVVFYDQRGTSRSSDSNGSETIDKYVEDIEAIRKAVGAPTVDLLGHSFGGYLAIAYTSRHPQHVRSLLFVDSAAPKLGDVTQLMDQIFPERIGEWRAKRATLGKRATAADVAVFQSMEFVDDVALREFLDAVKDHGANMEVNNTLRKDMADRDYWDDVRGFEQRALVLHGRYDAIIAPSNSWALHNALPNSTFHIIEAAGHLPHIERPQAFLAAVKPFLESLDHAEALRVASCTGPEIAPPCTEDIARVDPDAVYAAGRGPFLDDHRARPHIDSCEGWPLGPLLEDFGEEVQSDAPVLIVNGESDPATPPSSAH